MTAVSCLNCILFRCCFSSSSGLISFYLTFATFVYPKFVLGNFVYSLVSSPPLLHNFSVSFDMSVSYSVDFHTADGTGAFHALQSQKDNGVIYIFCT